MLILYPLFELYMNLLIVNCNEDKVSVNNELKKCWTTCIKTLSLLDSLHVHDYIVITLPMLYYYTTVFLVGDSPSIQSSQVGQTGRVDLFSKQKK